MIYHLSSVNISLNTWLVNLCTKISLNIALIAQAWEYLHGFGRVWRKQCKDWKTLITFLRSLVLGHKNKRIIYKFPSLYLKSKNSLTQFCINQEVCFPWSWFAWRHRYWRCHMVLRQQRAHDKRIRRRHQQQRRHHKKNVNLHFIMVSRRVACPSWEISWKGSTLFDHLEGKPCVRKIFL